MSLYDDLESHIGDLKDLSDKLDKIVSDLEHIDSNMEIEEAVDIVENSISDLKDINSDIY